MKKVCVITGTRAEFGLLKPLIEKITEDNELQLQLIVTGMHLSPEFGLTYKEIGKSGYKADEKIEILLSSDTPVGISKSMGLAMISFSETYARLKPDIIIVLGDRYEAFAAVSSAMISRIPVAHLYGGESTEGVIDEAIRHSITKMSYLHFTSTEEYKKRVIQLGEHPNRVFNVGALGIENIKKMKLLSKEKLEEKINFKFGEQTALVTFHPVTLDKSSPEFQFENLLNALNAYKKLKMIITKANSDTDGRIINQMIDNYVLNNKERTIAFTSMGQLNYLSAMKYVNVVIGNSSSGLIEAPALKVPTVNIGDRQRGRIKTKSVLDCQPEKEAILEKLKMALCKDFTYNLEDVQNPYGDGNVSGKVIYEIKKFLFKDMINIKKSFYDL